MTAASTGNTVHIHYTGTLDDGTEFDSSRGRDPLTFTLGEGQVIAGFDAAVQGMSPGDTKTVNIPAAEAYGAHDPARVQQVPRNVLPAELTPEVGMPLAARDPNGAEMRFVITALSEETITVDGNHPLAGKDLTFALELVAID